MSDLDNTALLEAIKRFDEAGEDGADELLRGLLQTLLQSQLLVMDDGELAYEETEDHRIYLALFTDPVEAHSFGAEGRAQTLSAEQAIERVAQGEYGGLVVNPAGQRFALSAEDVADFFDTGGAP